ncbi:MAG TPA: BlaI/MecI/CopY family transcriptional regulator [Puia sp.]|jgi:BlaI family penicillinase repressor|nr:BlaI/MecI/CopY family transcriptional regulator [Puia sp.]
MNNRETNTGQQELPEPTRAQLEILQVLWKHGPSTVRFVNDQLNQQKQALSYTSTLKLMQIMHEKGMLKRDESSMTHVYSSALEEQKTKGVVLKKFVDAVYNGSVKSMMLELLGNKETSSQQWDTIKDLLSKLDEDQ